MKVTIQTIVDVEIAAAINQKAKDEGVAIAEIMRRLIKKGWEADQLSGKKK